ncbi:MAG: hypothetical protein AAGA60_23295 [Cyanobacteria bacterium P01_E01_bin.42]
MNLLSSLLTLKAIATCQENWHIAAREREQQTLILGILGYLAIAGTGGDMQGAEMQRAEMQGVQMQGDAGDNRMLLDDTIVSMSADPSKTLDRFLGLPLRQASINKSLSEIACQINNYRHESESEREGLFEGLFVGLNPKPKSGGYRLKPTVPQ